MTRLILTVVLSLAVISIGSAAHAQSDATISPEGQYVLVQKNLGVQRWAIVRDQETRAITGNIFNPEGNGSQFVWCSYLGDELYDCVGGGNCATEPCPWAPIAQVKIPESFFALRANQPTPAPTSLPTPRPTTQQTPKPTTPPPTGLRGLLGTWYFTYEIISTFTDTLRLQRVERRDGVDLVFGLGEGNTPVVGGFIADVIESNLPFRFAVIDFGSLICTAYIFDQSGDAAAGLVAIADRAGSGCGQFRGGYVTVGIRLSGTASERTMSTKALRSVRRGQRARWLDARDAVGTADPGALDAITAFARAVEDRRAE